MALHSHLYLGAHKSDSDYSLSLIVQDSLCDHFLSELDIKKIGEDYYTLELVETNLFLNYNNEIKMPHLNIPGDNILFSLKTIQIIRDGIYIIKSKINNNILISFHSESKDGITSMTEPNMNRKFGFYIQFDPHDGCYSIINSSSGLGFSSTTNPSANNFVYQKFYRNKYYQKWIISSFDVSKGKFYFENKNSLLRLTITDPHRKGLIPLLLKEYDINYPQDINQMFVLSPANLTAEEQTILKDYASQVTTMREKLYNIGIQVADGTKTIEEDFFLNYFVVSFDIPNSVTDISQKAFQDCKLIKDITCDPFCLKFLPNPLNVETICINEGVKYLKEDCFNNYKYLKGQKLPKSLISVQQDAFKDVHDLEYYSGNLIFLRFIDKTSLTQVDIPNFEKS